MNNFYRLGALWLVVLALMACRASFQKETQPTVQRTTPSTQPVKEPSNPQTQRQDKPRLVSSRDLELKLIQETRDAGYFGRITIEFKITSSGNVTECTLLEPPEVDSKPPEAASLLNSLCSTVEKRQYEATQDVLVTETIGMPNLR